MPHNYSAHSKQFRQREFWLPHESPKSRFHGTTLLSLLLIICILIIIVLLNNKDTTEYATRDQVSKIETHLFQLEERLVWTDEKIDTIQAVAEASAMQALEEKNIIERNSPTENEPEPEEPETEETEAPVLTKIPEETIVPKKTQTISKPKPEPISKEVPVIQPKIKKKKIKRREFGIVYKYHKVRQGETLYRIGLKYNVPVTEIRRLNHLEPNESIHPGQRLLVSQGER
jgi:LysM repeat protein